ncbi:hypothetical protein CJD36_007930 [Flavipsychrobacter stenotrophus]|uniref:Uncharacterized protein n=1 Tax=Flavipsychrobacter stenotrophus TaxID=2077091 RepID=A0A2S7SYB6_9BACT|nr:SBBP repeat-containing protein [Flavipsychrobacter stenotrophus]PQJ11714.1 hypothetical protein CJD36_007930 [Flavipsychrobacter stenotrophus]
MYFNGTKCQLLLFSCLLSVSALAKDVKSLNAGGLQKPLCFVENKGQVLDENNHSRSDIQFKLSGKGVSLFVGNGQLHYQFKKVVAGDKRPDITTYAMDVKLLGANPYAAVKESDIVDYQENYYIPQSGPGGFHALAYRKITYSNVYPNIDWVLYVKDNNVEYDFVVREGGDVKNIRLQYGGATELSVTADGGILARTPMGDVTEKKPFAYESATHKKVSSRFSLKDNIVSFETGSYSGVLTIDPYLQWSTYFGGTNEDVATAVKISASGSVYVCGYTASTGLGTGTAPITTFGGGNYDAFVVRYPTAGNLVTWATYFGGSGEDKAMGMAIDASGIYMVGSSSTSLTSIASGAPAPFQSTNGGGSDIIVAKIAGGGGITWATYLGGIDDEFGYSITLDQSNNVYVAGSTESAGLATDATNLNGTRDGIMAKFSSAGVNQFVTYYGGTGEDEIRGVTLNTTTATAFVAVTGLTNSIVGIATIPAYQSAIGGTTDGFLARYSVNTATPSILWSTYIGGSSDDIGNSVGSDAANNVFVTGNTSANDAIASGISYTSTYGGLQDGFLMKFNVAGNKQWGTYLGGIDSDYAQAIVVDGMGFIAITGGTKSAGIASAGALQTGLSGVCDAFVAKYNTLGQKLYTTYFGRSGNDFANGITVDGTATAGATNSIVIAGRTTSPTGSGFATTGAASTTNNGNTEAFASKFARDTIVGFRQIFMDTLLCAGSSITVHDTVNYNFGAGNIFRVQLSDATGSFAAPVVIGSVTSSTFGAIPAIIPAGTAAGTGYRIRIVSTNPVTTSVDDNININIVTTLPATTVTANSPVCVGQTINFTVTAPYSVNGYSWSGPAGFTSTLQNPSIPSVTTANGGTYSVTVTHANNCPAYINTVPVLVNSFIPPTPLDSSNSPLCAGSTLQLFANPNFSGIFTYHWSGPGGFSSNLQNPVIPSIAYADTGFYYLTDTLDACPSLRDSIHIVINPTDTPNIVITVTPDDTVCVGTTFHFHVAVTNGGFSPQYQWLYGPTYPIVGAIFDNYASASLASGANISCVLTSSIACPDKPHDTSNIIVVTVLNNTPVVSITSTATSVLVGSTVTLTGYASGPSIVGYVWYVNGVVVPGATTTTLVLSGLTHSDTVRMEVLSTGLCASLGVSNTIIVHVGTVVVNTVPEFSAIEMFPNPNNGSFAIKGQLDNIADGQASVQVTNAIGQVVYLSEATIANGQLDKSVDMSNVPAGIYLLRLNKDGASKVFKFVKE